MFLSNNPLHMRYPGSGCRKIIPPGKLDGVGNFSMLLISATMTHVASSKNIPVRFGTN